MFWNVTPPDWFRADSCCGNCGSEFTEGTFHSCGPSLTPDEARLLVSGLNRWMPDIKRRKLRERVKALRIKLREIADA